MTFVRLYPAQNMNEIARELDRAMKHFFNSDTPAAETRESEINWNPRVDIFENEDAFGLTLEIPGVKQEDIQIQYEKDELVISGERKREDLQADVKRVRTEARYGKFRRAFQINTLIDQDGIEATFGNGLLHIRLPKAEAAKPKTITIKAGK
ncbi:MAG: Hsp20/alpha crystallin family protein [Calditrichae bacterium]|nr:Hsp20/alpha crystallin family protein [Calditrichia bacterium]